VFVVEAQAEQDTLAAAVLGQMRGVPEVQTEDDSEESADESSVGSSFGSPAFGSPAF
jgi:hypothetical protein